MPARQTPHDWSSATVADIVDSSRPVTYGVVQPGPRQESGIPIIRGQDYSSGAVRTDGLYLVHPSIAAAYRRSTVVEGDLLLSIVGYVGLAAQVPSCLTGANLTQTTARIAVRAGFEPRYFLHFFRGDNFRSEVSRYTKGSAQPGLNLADVEKFRLVYPPLPEQRRIAAILDTLDEAIRRTEQVIEKLKQMKQGLLHDLLTRGIDDNGELRPPPDEAPHLYKDSPLGRIPRDWEVRTVEGLLAAVDPAMRSGPFGSALLKHELVDTGIPLLGIDNVHVERFVAEYSRFVSPQKALELNRYRVRPRDVMITIMGTVGRCALVPDNIGEALSSKHVWTLTFDQNRYSPYLATLQFNYSRWVLTRFGQDEQGGIMSAIRSETLRTVRLPVPPRPEQDRLECVFGDLGKRIEGERLSLTKLRTLKHGLMDDLLTGRVRISFPEEEQYA